MRRKLLILAVFVTGLLLSARAPAQSLENRVVELRLDNGMLFLLVNRPQAPVFSGTIMVKVGGVDDPQGQTGMAHLFEHMAFKGTPWIGTADYEGEVGILQRIDSVAVQFTETLSPIPIADRDLLSQLVARTEQSLQANSQLSGAALDAAVANALNDTLTASPDAYPSLERFVAARRLYASMQALTEQHRNFGVKDEFSRIVRVNGGTGFNAGTGKDYTIYYESFPANRLELWAMLESQRFMYPVLREFYSERDVVAEERRMRVDDDPEGLLYEQFMATAFQAHPYRVSIVGWMSDVQRVTAEDAMRFRSRYYAPDNAIGVLVGDFDMETATATIRRYFGRIPASTAEIPEIRTLEPPQNGERRVEVRYDSEPMVSVGFHKLNYPHPDALVFSAIANIIRDSGNSSRLYRSMIQPGIASQVSIYEESPGTRYPNLCSFEMKPVAPYTTEDLERILYAELDSLANHPVSDFELQKCRNQLEAQSIRSLSDNAYLSRALARAQLINGDWRLVVSHAQRVSEVTAEDIMRVARTYFRPENRTVATLVKPDEQPTGTDTQASTTSE